MARSSVEDMTAATKIAFLTANEGIEQAELVEPWQALTDAGYEPVLLSPETGEVQMFERPADGRNGTAKPGTLRLRAPARPGRYTLYVLVGSHAVRATVVVRGAP